ncbi:uncharacterized protein LOC114358376 isoform X4 [Ostrinia furnacalis]|uniref:uncharacterized protein LOC114358376 isoform X4 n=1 Tax=Ostrinia furnacalis TaxID=93504 RepID=UPI00104046D1|nr:uncharacterized protein LOC114358376 isoform X4 [Ostrinia furnacalis]
MVFFTLYLSVVIILLVLYFIIELAEEDNKKMADNEHEESNKEPPIYMDMSVLKSKSQPNTPSKPTAYSINNRTFYDEERTSDEYIEFSLHAERLSNLANRELFSADMLDSDTDTQIMYCDSPDLVEETNGLADQSIREALHCAICNLPVAAGYIYAHLNELQHIGLLQKALSPKLEQAAIAPIAVPAKEPQKHEPEQKITSDKEKEVKTEITKAKTETKQAKTEATKLKTETKEVKTEITKIETTESVKDELESLASDMTADVDLNESADSVFDIEDYVYVKLGNKYFRISLLSYNSLVYTGCEDFYCFICSVNVTEDDLKTHVDSRSHMDSLKKCPFLVMEGVLLRQIFLKYHCGVCNVIITRECLKIHMKWQPHVELVALQNKITKKMRRNDLNSGMKMYVGNTQKETIYLNEKEPKIKVLFKVKFEEETTIEKKMKIIIVNGDVLKLNFDNWNGVAAAQNGLKCQLCQMEFAEGDLANHVNSQVHKDFLTCKVFKREYWSDLLREIDDTTLHCVICNTDVANKKPVATEHIEGKKHKKNYDTIRAVSSTTNAYTDCDDDVLQL